MMAPKPNSTVREASVKKERREKQQERRKNMDGIHKLTSHNWKFWTGVSYHNNTTRKTFTGFQNVLTLQFDILENNNMHICYGCILLE